MRKSLILPNSVHIFKIIQKIFFNKPTVIIYFVTVVALMLFSPSDTGIQNPLGMGEIGDYIAHFLVFLPFMSCGNILYGNRLRVTRWFLMGTLFVIALETTQYFLPYRGFNLYDILVGEIGLISSYYLMKLFRNQHTSKE